MQCLKCGRDTKEGESFCLDCQLTMQRYPVRPGTPVILPRRETPPARKTLIKRRAVPLEDQIRTLKRRQRLLSIFLITAVLIAALLAVPAWQFFFGERQRPGQNYTVVTNTTPPEMTPLVGNVP